MLIESIARKTLRLKRHCVKEVIEEDGQLIAYLVPDGRYKLVCSSCGNKSSGYDTLTERRWKHVPLWGDWRHLGICTAQSSLCEMWHQG